VHKSPGFLTSLQESLESLPEEILMRISRYGGLEIPDMIANVLRPVDHSICDPKSPDHVHTSESSNDVAHGKRALHDGSVAVLAYGDDAIQNSRKISELCVLPVLTLTTDLSGDLRTFETPLLTPQHVVEDPVTLIPCGTGDIVSSLLERGTLARIRNAGAKHIYITPKNVIDPRLIGVHLSRESSVTCEVVRSTAEDEILLGSHQGIDQLISKFRIHMDDPIEEPTDRLIWAWSGVAILDLDLDLKSISWRWHRRPLIKDGKVSYGFQRSFEDVTSEFKTLFVR
jgi:hypothetical protein